MGVVTSLEASSLETPFGDLAGLLLDLLRPVVTNLSEGVRRRGCLPHAKTPALLLVAGGHHSAVIRLLTAFRGAWSCVVVSSAVQDSV